MLFFLSSPPLPALPFYSLESVCEAYENLAISARSRSSHLALSQGQLCCTVLFTFCALPPDPESTRGEGQMLERADSLTAASLWLLNQLPHGVEFSDLRTIKVLTLTSLSRLSLKCVFFLDFYTVSRNLKFTD